MRKFFLIVIFICLTPMVLNSGTLNDSSKFKKAREKLVKNYIERKGIKDPKVLAAMREVQRHSFVPDELESAAYADRPLPIGEGQTISQPYVVALMTEILNLTDEQCVLEIGTGSGYQAAVLSKITKAVYSIEIKQKLHNRASKVLKSLGYKNIWTRHGDGYFGWKEAAPFDAIMITAAVDHIPPPLIKQLKNDGRLTLPLGNPFSYQNLVLVTKHDDDYSVKQITGVLFVPMTGVALERRGEMPSQ